MALYVYILLQAVTINVMGVFRLYGSFSVSFNLHLMTKIWHEMNITFEMNFFQQLIKQSRYNCNKVTSLMKEGTLFIFFLKHILKFFNSPSVMNLCINDSSQKWLFYIIIFSNKVQNWKMEMLTNFSKLHPEGCIRMT